MKIEVVKGDITQMNTDAIVNAANSSLLGGGGVDGAIHRAGGPQILEECIQIRNRQGGCKTGEAVITTGGLLKAGYVIHTVGPVWQNGQNNEDALLSNCYANSLKLAEDHNIETISFPNISTGIYRYPKQNAAITAIHAVREFRPNTLKKILFTCFDEENYLLYKNLLWD